MNLKGNLNVDLRPREVGLSDRMLCVAGMVTKGNVVCDVGCDHGFVPIYLVKNGISPRALAMDVGKGPLEAANEHIKEYALTDYIETRLSDGVTALRRGEADTLICAGMGGKLMKRIMEEGKDKIRFMQEVILQPQSEIQGIREFLRKQDYHIMDEDMILEDRKYYPVIKACPGTGKDEDSALQPVNRRVSDKYGPILLEKRNPVLHGFLMKERALCEEILAGLKKAAGGNEQQSSRRDRRQKEIEGRIKDIDSALSYFLF
ncbi:class I SAM-dependent methyltransferase [Kineothrix sedimenti]|uniref:Class I SAM-dependent methyltransferase n=1 Tax=Kineothrix sedimenti TaxID=3123317 RepID=A0ABZ3ET51_9FIRM